MTIRIPVSSPLIDDDDIKSVTKCLRSGWVSSLGEDVPNFEKRFSAYHSTKYGVATNSGTTALHLALSSLSLKEKDEIIMPTFTMIATINAAEYLKLKVKLIDANLKTWTMDINDLEKNITKDVKAIMAVHIYGHPENMIIVKEIAEKHNLLVIEDAAEAHGAERKNAFETVSLLTIGIRTERFIILYPHCVSYTGTAKTALNIKLNNLLANRLLGGMIFSGDEYLLRFTKSKVSRRSILLATSSRLALPSPSINNMISPAEANIPLLIAPPIPLLMRDFFEFMNGYFSPYFITIFSVSSLPSTATITSQGNLFNEIKLETSSSTGPILFSSLYAGMIMEILLELYSGIPRTDVTVDSNVQSTVIIYKILFHNPIAIKRRLIFWQYFI